jgi:hypothetical protein
MQQNQEGSTIFKSKEVKISGYFNDFAIQYWLKMLRFEQSSRDRFTYLRRL